MKKTIIQNIIFAVAAVVVYKVLFAPTDIKTDISKYEKQIIVLEQKVDSLHTLNQNKFNTLFDKKRNLLY